MNIVLTEIINLKGRTKTISSSKRINANEICQKKKKKKEFAGLNDKRFYFHDGIVLLPFGHFLLEKTRKEKKEHRNELHTLIQQKMFDFLAAEGKAVHLCERLRVLRSIYAQPPILYVLFSEVLVKSTNLRSTRELILNRSWK